jgi:putative transferase (TIGR04331 family)
MPNRLILGPIPDDFNPSSDRLVWPGSIVGKESSLHYPNALPIRHDNKIKNISDVTAIRNTINTVFLKKFSNYLNTYHKQNYSIQFWTILLDYHLFMEVYILWQHYQNLTYAIDQLGKNHYDCIVLKKFPFESPPIDPFHLRYRVHQTIQFHHWILSSILCQLNPINVNCIDGLEQTLQHNKNEAYSSLKNKDFPRCGFISGMSNQKMRLLSLYLSIKKPSTQTHKIKLSPLDASELLPKEFIDIATTILMQTLPLCYTKNFDHFNNYALKKNYKPGKYRLYGPVLHGHEYLKFCMAHAYEKGERIIGYQHGSGYGLSKTHHHHCWVEYIDTFVSWGWTDNFSKILALPSPLLSSFNKKYKKNSESLILINTGGLPPVLHSSLTMRHHNVIFLNALNPSIRAQTFYRPYNRDPLMLDDSSYISNYCPTVKFIENQHHNQDDLHKKLFACKLTVLGNPGTSFLIALMANIPTVCYFHPDHWAFTPHSQITIDKLKLAKVIFDTPEAAAQHVNQYWHDIDTWWQSHTVQEARLFFNQNYALTKKNWFFQWFKALRKL